MLSRLKENKERQGEGRIGEEREEIGPMGNL
jgi:hypothetical protein